MQIRDVLGGSHKPWKRRKKRGARQDRLVQKALHSIKEASGNKNTHLMHAEELVFSQQRSGAESAIKLLTGFTQAMAGGPSGAGPDVVSVKWDGAPAIIAGTDPADGKFFVGTKGVFGKREPKLNKTPEDIERFHADKDDKDGSSLRNKLKIALEHFPKLGIEGVLQGDLMFTPDTLKSQSINGEEYLTFKPNTITYAVPSNSDIAEKIRNAKIGIVWHTAYEGPSVGEMSAQFGANIDGLQETPDVWFDDAVVTDVSGSGLSKGEAKPILSMLNTAGRSLKSLSNDDWALITDSPIKNFHKLLLTHVNRAVRAGKFEQANKFFNSFIVQIEQDTQKAISTLKTGPEGPAAMRKMQDLQRAIRFVEENKQKLYDIYNLHMGIMEAKDELTKHLNKLMDMKAFIQQPDGSFAVTPGEGVVIADHMGNAMKVVDRLDFSKANFAPKDFQ
tara:strand:- start:106 stop:1446 length:1341 start_codon:yes stop_codon:yes gene_type:complete